MKDVTVPSLGQKFYKWEITDDTPIYKKDQRYFKVKCDCGTTTTVHWSSLRLGKTKQCQSCSRKSKQGQFKLGERIKGFTVISDIPKIVNSSTRWKVKCDCGYETYMLCSHLFHKTRWKKCKRCSDLENSKNYAIHMGQIGIFRISFINRFKSKAIQRGIEFSEDITPQHIFDLYIKQNKKCALSGRELILIPGNSNASDSNISIDRIDSSCGYSINNIQLVTKQVNVSKHILSNDEFINLCKSVVNNVNQQPSQT